MIWFSASCTWTNLPNSVGLLALPLRMISVCGSIGDDLAWKTRDSLEDPGLGLLHHLPHSLGHEFQCFRHLPHPLAATRCKMLHLLHHALGLIQNLHRYLNPCSKIRRPSSRVACRRLTSYWASFRQVAAPKNRRVAKTSGRLPEKYVFRKTSTAASNAWNEPRQRSASPAVPKPMSPLTRSQGLCARRESRSDRRRKILPLCRSRARAPRACARCRAENRRALQARARRPDPAQDWKAPRGAKRCGKRHRLRTPVAASELHVLERVAVEHANDAAVLRVVFLVRAGRARRDSLPGRRAQG